MLASPEVVAIPVEGHDEDVTVASIRLPIKGVVRVAGHPSLASGVLLQRFGWMLVPVTDKMLIQPGDPNQAGTLEASRLRQTVAASASVWALHRKLTSSSCITITSTTTSMDGIISRGQLQPHPKCRYIMRW